MDGVEPAPSAEQSFGKPSHVQLPRLAPLIGTRTGSAKIHDEASLAMGNVDLRARLDILEQTIGAASAKLEAQNEEIKWLRETLDAAHLLEGDSVKARNLYSYSVEMLLNPEACDSTAMLSLKLIGMVIAQILMAFGFFDAAWLALSFESTNLLGDRLSFASFYPHSHIAWNNEAHPWINVLTSAIGMMLLCQAAHKENCDTLLTMPPLVVLLYQCLDGSAEKWSLSRRLWQVVACVLLQCAWCVRALFVPIAAGLGTAMTLAASDAATEVVMNAVAVAFLFEMDEMAFETLVNPRQKKEYIKRPRQSICRLTPGNTLARQVVLFRAGWAIFVVDLFMMSQVYVVSAWNLQSGSVVELPYTNCYWAFAAHAWCRAAMFALVQTYFMVTHLLGSDVMAQRHRVRREAFAMVLSAGLIVACGFTRLFWPLSAWFGARRGENPTSPLATCLNQLEYTSPQCNDVMMVSGSADGDIIWETYSYADEAPCKGLWC